MGSTDEEFNIKIKHFQNANCIFNHIFWNLELRNFYPKVNYKNHELEELSRAVNIGRGEAALIVSENVIFIEKAVWATRYMMRDYLKYFFETSFNERTFKSEVECVWIDWISREYREHIFIQTVDTLAIISEAFLFCDRRRNYDLNIIHAVEWFLEWFGESMRQRFLLNGGWTNLNDFSRRYYSELYSDTAFNEFEYCDYIYNIDTIFFLWRSPIFFPLPRELFGCRFLKHCNYKDVVYVRLKQEDIYEAAISRTQFLRKMSFSLSFNAIKNIRDNRINDLKTKCERKVNSSEECDSVSDEIQMHSLAHIHIVHDPSPFVDLESMLLRHYGEKDTIEERKLIFISKKFAHSFEVFKNEVSPKNIKLLSITECELNVVTEYFFESDGLKNSASLRDNERLDILTSVYGFYYVGHLDGWWNANSKFKEIKHR